MSFYVQKIKENYYFRIRVPQDLQYYFPYQEIKRSLRTKNNNHAKSLARIWSSKTENVFMTLRSNILTPEQVKDYIRRELPSRWKKSNNGKTARGTCKNFTFKEDKYRGKWRVMTV